MDSFNVREQLNKHKKVATANEERTPKPKSSPVPSLFALQPSNYVDTYVSHSSRDLITLDITDQRFARPKQAQCFAIEHAQNNTVVIRPSHNRNLLLRFKTDLEIDAELEAAVDRGVMSKEDAKVRPRRALVFVEGDVNNESTFHMQPGNAGADFVSFESVALPGQFIRHDIGQVHRTELYLEGQGGNFSLDSSFRLVPWESWWH